MPDAQTSGVLAASVGADRATPRSVGEVVDVVRAAQQDDTPLRVVGSGTWLGAGAPVHAVRHLDVSGLSGIVEYVPGDLTLTAKTGTTLEEIAQATREHAQWLPLDPFGDPRGTLGATLATASAGPLGGSIGLPRDMTVGVSFVTGSGEVVRGGGKVVKNVAGFDLVRMTIGAWGTLGVITEATVRLRARPEADETMTLVLPDERDALGTLLSILRTAAVDLLAAELVSAACAARIGLESRGVMMVRMAGNAVGVHHQRAVLARLAACEPVSSDLWSRLRHSDPPDAHVVRVSRRPSELARLWSSATSIPGVDAHATMARGVVRLRLPSSSASSLGAFEEGDRMVVETGSPAWPRRTEGDPVGMIAQRLRLAFDPARILNRGIFGEALH